MVEHEIIRDHSTKRSRGFGFIIFDSEQAVDDLLEKDNMIDFSGSQVSPSEMLRQTIVCKEIVHMPNLAFFSGKGAHYKNIGLVHFVCCNLAMLLSSVHNFTNAAFSLAIVVLLNRKVSLRDAIVSQHCETQFYKYISSYICTYSDLICCSLI